MRYKTLIVDVLKKAHPKWSRAPNIDISWGGSRCRYLAHVTTIPFNYVFYTCSARLNLTEPIRYCFRSIRPMEVRWNLLFFATESSHFPIIGFSKHFFVDFVTCNCFPAVQQLENDGHIVLCLIHWWAGTGLPAQVSFLAPVIRRLLAVEPLRTFTKCVDLYRKQPSYAST